MAGNSWHEASEFLKSRAAELLGTGTFAVEPLVGNVHRHTVVSLPGDSDVGLVLGGLLKQSVVTSDGREVTIRYVSAGKLYGLIDNSQVTVARTAIVMRFERGDFDSLLTQSHALQAKIIADATTSRERMADRLAVMVCGSAESKIARALISIAYDCQQTSSKTWWTIPYFTHEELASYSGLTRSTLTKALLGMRKQGVVRVERGVGIWFDFWVLSRW